MEPASEETHINLSTPLERLQLLLTLRKVLLVSKDQDDRVPHLAVVDDPVKLLSGLVYPVSVRAVYHEN